MNPHNYKLFVVLVLTTGISCSDLKQDEIAKVKFVLYGDFGSEQSQITLMSSNGISKAKLKTKDSGDYEVPIDEKGLNAFNSFLTELKTVGSAGYCTTDQSCTVYTRNEKVIKKHIDCSWKGFYSLKKALFNLP